MTTDNKDEWVKVGCIGVDAGMVWIGDPCYILHKENPPKEIGTSWIEFCDIIGDKKLDNNNSAQFNYDLGHSGLGVVVSSGFGDGCYSVYVKTVDIPNWGKRVKEMKVVFIEDEDLTL